MCREYLCDCLQFLHLDFDNCLKLSENNSESIPPVGSACHEDECVLGADDIDLNEKVFEFVTIPSFVGLLCEVSNEPVYILKVEENGIVEKEKTDGYGHGISTGEYFLRGKCLKIGRSRSTRCHKFSILTGDELCTVEEMFEVFADISDDRTLDKETFKVLQMRAGTLQAS